jgi:Ni,Fe-hydrogenase III large subunit/Ni,Fe-hydrogenase III component G
MSGGMDRPATAVLEVTAASLPVEAATLLDTGWRLALAAAHEEQQDLRVVYTFLRPVHERRELVLRTPKDDPTIPTLSGLSYPASRFEREMHDLFGIDPVGHPLPRRLVRHGHWPAGWYPMRRDAGPAPAFAQDVGSYPFLDVSGPGVYDIPVGPIHAGLIEPGHFRFSVVGETILRMTTRLWFVHRGMERLFEGRSVEAAIPLAERVSGDTAVGHTLAFLSAVEDASGITPRAAVQARRATLLELERLHNHVADLGALANDVGLGIVHVHTQRLRETLLRHNEHVTGHRLLRGALELGGAHLRHDPDLDLLAEVVAESRRITELTLGHATVADRFTGTAILPTERAAELDTLGYVARASGRSVDARSDHPAPGLDLSHEPVVETGGDVLARFLVRAREIDQSLEIMTALARRGADDNGGPTRPGDLPGVGLGVVEGWRGTICHRVETTPERTLARVKIVDPSWFNWPALPVALADTIVPDFPLANKSFNQSYAGNDL